ncbi:MAG: DUF84 family protein [Calditrichales bacterium]|nr:MAG: DUF84 family protein [Calditrichales bacterium]
MIIGIGTNNPPKVNACKSVIYRLFPEFNGTRTPQFLSHKVPSGVSDMPMSQQEMMEGARNRARNLHQYLLDKEIQPDYVIGLEGGFFHQVVNGAKENCYFLQSWVYVLDGSRGHWGCSGGIPVPKKISDPVVDSRQELAVVIDQVSGKKNVRSEMGAVGILTNGIVNRQSFFENALEFAFAPFYNPKFYE